jgi:hypothetical protein
MIPHAALPLLTLNNHRVTSPANIDYNCIAWSAGDTENWWQPGRFWPVQVLPGDYTIGALIQMFTALGYEDCGLDAGLEPGFEKVALFGDSLYYTHAARQLPSGKWTSKLGKAEDIEHDSAGDVAGGVYGILTKIMRRPLTNTEK